MRMHLAHLARRALELGGDLGGGRFAPELLDQQALGVDQLVQPLDHVHGDADRAPLSAMRARDGLADPPGRVGRELVAAAVVELLDRADQPERALLDQVQEASGRARRSPWRSRRPGAGWPRPCAAWRPCRRARCAWPAPPPPRRSAAARGRSSAGTGAASRGSARPSGRPRRAQLLAGARAARWTRLGRSLVLRRRRRSRSRIVGESASAARLGAPRSRSACSSAPARSASSDLDAVLLQVAEQILRLLAASAPPLRARTRPPRSAGTRAPGLRR